VAAGVAALALYVYSLGWTFAVIRSAAARLPALRTAGLLGTGQLVGQGLGSVTLMAALLAVAAGIAYLTSHRRWDVNGQDWHDIVIQHGVSAPRSSAIGDAWQEHGRRERRHAGTIAARAERVEQWLRSHPLAPLASGPGAVKQRARGAAATLPEGDPRPLAAAPLGDWAVRLIAGFNIMVLAGLAGVGVARGIGALIPFRPWAAVTGWMGIVIGILVFLAVRWLLTAISPLKLPAALHGLTWVTVAIATLFAAVPIGILVLTGVAVSTAGRALARLAPPATVEETLRSPVLWALLAICTLLGAGFSALPQVGFAQASVATPAGDITGGFVARTPAGVWMATCTALADATSTDERLAFIPAARVDSVDVAGAEAYLDSGRRPSIGRLVLGALGLGADPPTLFDATLRARQPTCAGAGPTRLADGVWAPRLGGDVIAQGPSAGGRSPLDERPVQSDGVTPRAVAALARRYQPTLLVTAADRNWPVSVNAILAERGPTGQPVCLVTAHGPRSCSPTAAQLTPAGATPRDYLQLPVMLGADRSPDGQFQAFLRGEDESSGPLDQWLADPSRLDPWYSAEIYFDDAGPLRAADFPERPVDPRIPSGLIALEYWFYYPFNYYPVIVDSGLMDEAPIAGDDDNVDLHQGDWEHIDVLLNPATMTPEWLYMARHSDEGRFVRWSSPALQFDGTHPVIQAAFGGHPSYLPGCGAAPRAATLDASSDWLSCGSGRFAFAGGSTPLVNIAAQPWACWPGSFGEATPLEVSNTSSRSENILETLLHVLYVAGPRGPLVQAENAAQGVCPLH
jgi:hypothetical protein